MLIVTDPSDPTPIYRQVAHQIAGQIRDGSLPPGARLPTAADLAASLNLNRNTVLAAYRQLRDSGAIDLRRGRGAVVRHPDPTRPNATAPSAAASPESVKQAPASKRSQINAPPSEAGDLEHLTQSLVRVARSREVPLERVVELLKQKGLK